MHALHVDIDESSTNNGGSALNCTNGYEMLPNGSCVGEMLKFTHNIRICMQCLQ